MPISSKLRHFGGRLCLTEGCFARFHSRKRLFHPA
jgi:hypothetical protein